MIARNRIRTLFALSVATIVVFGFMCGPVSAGQISYVLITGDDDSGISTDNIYTHALDFGTGAPGALVNGVQFDAYNAAANGTLNFNREAESGSYNDHGGNGNHNVTGGLVDLMTDMYYNGNNAAGGVTTWTLSGLTPGKTYHARIYTRQWGASDSRTVTFVFDPDGAGPVSDSTGLVSQDNATSVGFANGNDAHYINYQFKAVAGENLVITLTQDNLNNSWHLYGLTNQEFSAETASPLEPGDQATDVLRDADLTWAPGDYAVTHNLYLGESFEAVDTATVPTASDLTDTSFDPGRLELGKTYYWRVDEVNGAPDKTVFKGDVWRFEVEPYSILVPGSTISVTASSSSNEFSGPEKTIDGSGLDPNSGMHDMAADTMWFTAPVDLDPWIQYEFENAKKLDTMTVWNSNGAAESAIGWGVKDVEIATSVDGENWDVLADANQFSRAPGVPVYNQPDTIAFNGVAAKYVRLNIQSNWGGVLMSYGLSEVQFTMIPVRVRTPEPEAGSVDILPDTVVTWRAGRDVDVHRIYVSTDMNAVADGTAPSVTSPTNSLNLASLDLGLGQTYYWRVDEVNEAEAVTAWAGPMWSLSLPETLVIDDFEGYGNLSPDRPFQTWQDGFGFSADEFFPAGYGGNGTGAGIGHDIWSLSSPHFDGDLMETLMVYGGSQSMPVYYDGAGSQVDLPLDGQDWTGNGIQTLSIAFHGLAGNTGQLYAKINNVKIAYDGDPADIADNSWLLWHIDLSSVSGLDNVTALSIGVDGAGAAGVLYVDDIKLSAQALQSTGPVFSFVKITGDEDCGISSDNSYTHVLDFGTGSPGALVNGVQFDAYNNAANGTLNFNREVSSGGLSDHAGNGSHNVAGGMVDLMTDMYYNSGTAPGGTTTLTLSGLTAGQTYNARVYTRQWGPTDSRNATFVFDPDGAGPISDSTGQLSQDNAVSAGFANGNDAYYISYPFTAVEGEDLVITVTHHISTYSWHLYGLTNQVQ